MVIERSNFLLVKSLAALACLMVLTGCSAIASLKNTGVVVSPRAQIRSSTAVVAADLLEVNRGDNIDILDSVDIPDPQDNSRKERWLRVRSTGQENIEGWIEARNVMPQDVLDRSRKLGSEDKEL